ncbi:hypothetical protein TI04_03560 [Achromatium sp. WMS2]|nr:hypothetical protein TI04_03560 [Achromatium sp. WMS2]
MIIKDVVPKELAAGGALYVVATPIGNLRDISPRALDVLRSVDLIAAEDTRQTARLLQEYGVRTPMSAYHEHNETSETERLVALIIQGAKLALVSDAGTPLVSDPGFKLVRAIRDLGLPVIPIPGACALVCALSASGMASDRFLFLGFPPRHSEARQALFQAVSSEPGTLILYEAGPRIQDTLMDLNVIFGSERNVVLARELTKLYETFLEGTPTLLLKVLEQDPMQKKGEHVMLIAGARQQLTQHAQELEEAKEILKILLDELPLKQATKLAARISGCSRNELYKTALSLLERSSY